VFDYVAALVENVFDSGSLPEKVAQKKVLGP